MLATFEQGMQVLPDDLRDQRIFVTIAVGRPGARETDHSLDFVSRDGDLQPHVGLGSPRASAPARGPRVELALVPAARTPQARKVESRCDSKTRDEIRARAARCRRGPTSPCIRAVRGVLSSRTSDSRLARDRRRASFGQNTLGDFAIVNVGATKQLQQLVIARPCQVEAGTSRRPVVADAVEPSLEPIDAGRIAVRVLIAVISVVPVEDVQAPVGPGFL